MTDRLPELEPMQPRVPLPPARPHSPGEDAYALFVGCVLLVLGLVLLRSAGLVTGGMAGVALLVSYLVPLPAGVLFTLINIPFFLFAWFAMGPKFTAKAVAANIGIASISALTALSLKLGSVHPAYAALAGGTVIGLGLLIMARHDTGVGGTGVVTLFLQRRRGWHIARTQMVLDAIVLLASTPLVTPGRFAWSMLSAAAMTGVLVLNHVPGRYTGH
jgi:uncharacterized membrane-anchored protein YitT (DUF2179 family)